MEERAHHRAGDIDELLGEASRRYFGSGYRRIRYALDEISIDPLGGACRALATIHYPPDWSCKSAGPLTPHLSTTDLLVVGAQLSDIYTFLSAGLTVAEHRCSWLRRVEIRAGRSRIEQFTAIPVAVRHLGTEDRPDSLCGRVSRYRTEIADFRAEIEIDHPAGSGRPHIDERACFGSLDEILGYGVTTDGKCPQNADLRCPPDQAGASLCCVQTQGGSHAQPRGLAHDTRDASKRLLPEGDRRARGLLGADGAPGVAKGRAGAETPQGGCGRASWMPIKHKWISCLPRGSGTPR